MKVSRAELASIFGVTPPAIDGWVRRGCPVAEASRGKGRGKGAKFWCPDVLAWYVRTIVMKGGPGGGAGAEGDGPRDLRTRLLRAQTESAEFALERLRGSLMTVEEWETTVSAAFARVGARIRAVRPKLAAAAVGVETIQQGLERIEPVVEELLQELSTADDVPRVTELDEAEDAAA